MLMLIILFVAIIVIYRLFTNIKSNSVACLVGKTAIITGGNSGIGYETSVLLASRGCRIIIADIDDSTKSCEKIQKLTGNKNVTCKYLNLASLKSVREFAQEIKKEEEKIDILINNAGVGLANTKVSEDGLNTVMQINYFSAFLLTHLLVDLLKKSGTSRVVFLTSTLSFCNNLTVENLNDLNTGDSIRKIFVHYANTKVCMMMAGQEFGKRLKKYGITSNSADPGTGRTQIFNFTSAWGLLYESLFKLWPLILGHSSFIAAQTSFHVASSEALEGVTSKNFQSCRPFFKSRLLKNKEFCRKIWEKTEELVQLKPEEKL